MQVIQTSGVGKFAVGIVSCFGVREDSCGLILMAELISFSVFVGVHDGHLGLPSGCNLWRATGQYTHTHPLLGPGLSLVGWHKRIVGVVTEYHTFFCARHNMVLTATTTNSVDHRCVDNG